ncbi:hypothetical protein [Mycolicibacterium hodleri]|uniref:hypothetical protein n=1 Tax=Mycolicibacterium hodleri TaxID=49897 RepID=UPI001F2C2839|nr:hypothetical protein [Mycolicibacterium hodleri]
MNTSTGRPSTEPADSAISCAPELPSGVTKRVKSGVMGLVTSTITLPRRAFPYSLTTATALA